MKGVVNWFDAKKGYGFILGADDQAYFVHYKDISKSGFKNLCEGDDVEFSTEKTPKGVKAIGVVLSGS